MDRRELKSDAATTLSQALPPELSGVMRLIDAGQLREARQRLENSGEQPADLLELVRLKLSVAERELPAASALE
ncbi:MAG TPA: hypothetical protein VG963_00565, partial [Polyangiaceae bacterium]|nr:hypothetical protein [Polyangiaceae bacterium]